MNELEMLATLIAQEVVLSVDSRMTRAFDRLMAPEDMDTEFFAVEESWAISPRAEVLTYTARA